MTEISAVVPADTAPSRPAGPTRADALRGVAREFEAAFLAEMLKHAGVGAMTEGFNGGPGEAAFADMLTREYAQEIARTSRFGLAEQVLRSLQGAEE